MPSILIIDDQLIFRAVLTDFFRQEGWRVYQADNGQTGKQSALVNQPTAIMSDLHMPDGSGLDVCCWVRAEPSLAEVRFILSSGTDNEATRQLAFAAGADAYAVKPLTKQHVHELALWLEDGKPESGRGGLGGGWIFFPDGAAGGSRE